MTTDDDVSDLFGLAGTFPRPAWVVLDAARDHRFTGELVFDANPSVRVCFDRGQIYLAEHTTDPSLGARLVDAGALNAAQLEHGSMRVGDAEHLGRLFERTPSVDRQFVLVVTEMMNEACIAQLAGRHVSGVDCVPYRYHSSGIHRWHGVDEEFGLRPGDPLPPPGPMDAPVETSPPESLFVNVSNDTDTLIRWDQPSWLDERMYREPARTSAPAAATSSWLDTDWADRLERDGLPTPEDDPLATPTPLPAMSPTTTHDRFEIIWPSGEVDEGFGQTDSVTGLDERDRVGPTARVSRSADTTRPHDPVDVTPGSEDLWEIEITPPTWRPAGDDPLSLDDAAAALATRRAVASIDTGSIDARRRLVEASIAPATMPSEPDSHVGIATANVWSVRDDGSSRSVFDEPADSGDDFEPEPRQSRASALMTNHGEIHGEIVTTREPPRTSALRRLIGGLRRT